jgi:hypothetical protein
MKPKMTPDDLFGIPLLPGIVDFRNDNQILQARLKINYSLTIRCVFNEMIPCVTIQYIHASRWPYKFESKVVDGFIKAFVDIGLKSNKHSRLYDVIDCATPFDYPKMDELTVFSERESSDNSTDDQFEVTLDSGRKMTAYRIRYPNQAAVYNFLSFCLSYVIDQCSRENDEVKRRMREVRSVLDCTGREFAKE